MKALVLEEKNKLSLREIDLPQELGEHDVRIQLKAVGICGSDLHFYTHGRIGPYVVNAPMVLGHEAAGQVVEIGSAVRNLSVGDRVCMEPGIPDWRSDEARQGQYNLDPSVHFWATPPAHGCMCPSVVHPANLTFKLPDDVSYQEGAFVEPLAVGVQAANKAQIQPGMTALVHGAGTIGIMTAFAALAGGCSKVLITDVQQQKLDIAGNFEGIVPINVGAEKSIDAVLRETDGKGVDLVFEASGNKHAYTQIFEEVRPGGRVVLIGISQEPIPLDLVAAQIKEVQIATVFRYANVFDRTVALLASGKIDVKPLISKTYDFEDSIAAYEFAARGNPDVVKVQILFSSEA